MQGRILALALVLVGTIWSSQAQGAGDVDPGIPGSEVLATDIYDAENLAFDTRGRLFVTGGDGLHLIVFGQDGQVVQVTRHVLGLEGNFVGVALGPDGHLYVGNVRGRRGQVLRVDIESEGFPFTVYYEGELVTPNGLRFDDDGSLYVADFGYYLPGKGALWRLEPGPDPAVAVAERVVDGVTGVNGIAIDRRLGRLYFTRTLSGKVFYLERQSSGRFGGEVTRLIDFDLPGPRFPIVDDLALDAEGNLYVCLYNANEIRIVSPEGAWTHTLAPEGLKHPTAVAFGVLEGDTRNLYITQKGRILAHDRRGGDRVSRLLDVAAPYRLPFVAERSRGGGVEGNTGGR